MSQDFWKAESGKIGEIDRLLLDYREKTR